MKKHFLSIILVLILAFGVLPGAACAEADVQQGDFIYIGEYNGQPIKWRVLDGEKMNNGEPGFYLFSEYALEDGGVIYSDSLAGWQGSAAQSWCGQMLDDSFTAAERNLIPAVSKIEESVQLYGLIWGETSLDNEQLFFISAPELAEYVGANDGDEGLSGFRYDGTGAYYWLRTSHAYHNDYAGLVLENNEVHDFLVYGSWGVRPAMNLDPDAAMFISPAGSSETTGNIVPIERTESGEWKTTVLDESRSFEITDISGTGDKLEISYTAELTGGDEFVSAVVFDADGDALAYGKLCKANESGTVVLDMDKVDIPKDGKICIFSETIADYGTSYASEPQKLGYEVSFAPGEGSGEMESLIVTPGENTVLPECTFAAPDMRCFSHWELNGKEIGAAIVPDGNIELAAAYKDVTAESISFSQSEVKLDVGENLTVNAEVHPENTADKGISWSSENSKICRVKDNGDGSCSIKGFWPGETAVIAASADGGAESSLKVTVEGSEFAAFMLGGGYLIAAAVLSIGIASSAIIIKKRKQA